MCQSVSSSGKLPPSQSVARPRQNFHLQSTQAYTHTHTHRQNTIFKLGKAPFSTPKEPFKNPFPFLPGARALFASAVFLEGGGCTCAKVCVWRNFLIYFLANGSRPFMFYISSSNLAGAKQIVNGNSRFSNYWFSDTSRTFPLSLTLDTQLTVELHKLRRWRLMAKVEAKFDSSLSERPQRSLEFKQFLELYLNVDTFYFNAS